MALTHHHSSLANVLSAAALAAANFLMPLTASAALDQSAPASVIKTTIESSKKIGEYKGNTYYFKPAGPGTGQIFRVPTGGNPTTFAMVGLIMNGKYSGMDAKEKPDFFALVTDTPASDIAGVVAAPPQVAVQPVIAANPVPESAGRTAFSAKASRGDDGNTPTVQFNNDSKFNNDIIEWRMGHIEIHRNGDKVADLGYTGGGYGEGAAKRDLKISLNEIGAAVTNGRKNDVLSTGWEVTSIKGTYNTAVVEARRAPGGITQAAPYGFEGEAVAATGIFRQQVDQSFTYPGYEKLCKFVGATPDPISSTTQH